VPAPVFIGDEVSAAAYRLAGMDARVTERGKVAGVFGSAMDEAGLVIITADLASALPGDTLADAVRRADPLIVVVPDGGNRHAPEDLDARVERVLGIEQ
jgi:vacuolar-type H+-ATPase subunit F/Vma7